MSTISTVLAVALSTASVSASTPGASDALPAQTITVVAIAQDVHAFVLRDGGGNLQRHAEGAVLGAWRVTHVSADTVVLESTRRLAGQTVEMRLHSGASIDLNADAAKLDALRGAQQIPVQTRFVPNKPKSSASH